MGLKPLNILQLKIYHSCVFKEMPTIIFLIVNLLNESFHSHCVTNLDRKYILSYNYKLYRKLNMP